MGVLQGRKRSTRPFRFTGRDVAGDIRAKFGFDGDLLQIFTQNAGAVVNKWHHYIPIYERYFCRFRGQPVRFLEIGVSKGGSLQMWRKYLGDAAILYGIDIDPTCARFDGKAGQVRIGSQDDPAFLASVVDEMGGVDVVLDDGSHVMKHIRASLEALFPLLEAGGVYMIEDLHTAYWKEYGGSVRRPGNFFHDIKPIIDDMHSWYHDRPSETPALHLQVSGVHVHDSIAVLEKAILYPPVFSRVGRE
jgi:Methyltransferase domain